MPPIDLDPFITKLREKLAFCANHGIDNPDFSVPFIGSLADIMERARDALAGQPVVEALKDAQRAINSMKAEAETGAQLDEPAMLEALETISSEGLNADMAIRAALSAAPPAPVAEGGKS